MCIGILYNLYQTNGLKFVIKPYCAKKSPECMLFFDLTTSATSAAEVTDLKTVRPKLNCRHFEEDIFKCGFLNENVCTLKLLLFPGKLINNKPALVQFIAWCHYLN